MTRKTLVTQWSGRDDMKVAVWQGDTGETAHEDTKRERGGRMRATARTMEQHRKKNDELKKNDSRNNRGKHKGGETPGCPRTARLVERWPFVFKVIKIK